MTTDALVGVIQLAGMRKLWDAVSTCLCPISDTRECPLILKYAHQRFADLWLLRRFSRNVYQWYLLQKPPPGLGWLINPRDCTGISTSYFDGDSDGLLGGHKEIVLAQASTIDDQRAPVVRNRTRMNM